MTARGSCLLAACLVKVCKGLAGGSLARCTLRSRFGWSVATATADGGDREIVLLGERTGPWLIRFTVRPVNESHWMYATLPRGLGAQLVIRDAWLAHGT